MLTRIVTGAAFPLPLLIAFGSSCASTRPPSAPVASKAIASTAPASPSVDRGPSTIAIDGDPNGLFWDDSAHALLIADDANNRILKWIDGIGVSKVADLPAAPAGGPGLGQLVRLADGSIVVTRFGHGTEGDVVVVKTDGSSFAIAGLDKARRRIGLAVSDDGTLYDSYFVKPGATPIGTVAKLGLDGTETDVVTSLQKPVGLLTAHGTLFISDPSLGAIVTTPTSAPGTTTPFATLPTCDLLAAGPNGTLFTGGKDGVVRQIDGKGGVTTFASGFSAVRGVAYDPSSKRLFFSDHVSKPSAGKTSAVQVRPVP